MTQSPTLAFSCALLLGLLQQASARQYLRAEPRANESEPDSSTLLEDLESAIGSERRIATEKRVAQLEEVIRPVYRSLPVTSAGGLKPDSVRYLMHRIFMERHGWFVKGLEPRGDAWSSGSPIAILEERGESEVHGLFEARLADNVFDLHHVAVLAATLENMVHAETVHRLHAAYRVLGISHHETSASEAEIRAVLDTYMVIYMAGLDSSLLTRAKMPSESKVRKMFPTFERTMQWAYGLRDEVLQEHAPSEATSFETTLHAVEVIADKYARFQNKECTDIKDVLLQIESSRNGQGDGRAPLDSFYESALNGHWQLGESVEYLRSLGALDETDPERPSVMISNYINGPSNCLASSKFYSVCCIPECESLLGHLETDIAAPDASPERISELVSALPSSTVSAPRVLSGSLEKRLSEIADYHGGRVPLHGRLFAQWLHHAYPRECPYPHLSGTTKPVTAKEWRNINGGRAMASKDSMRQHVEQASQRADRPFEEMELPWSSDEELFVCHRPESRGRPRFLLVITFVLALCAAIIHLVKVAGDARDNLTDSLKKHRV